MRNKSIKKALWLFVFVLVCCVSGVWLAACGGEASLEKEYYAYYGERFMLPQTDGGEYYVTDADGGEVEIVLGGFSVSSKGDYLLSLKKGKKKESSLVRVLERGRVNFFADKKTAFASLGEETLLPVFKAVHGDSGDKAEFETALLSPSGEEIGKNLTEFTPDRIGTYLLKAVAASGETEEAAIEVGESALYKNLLAPMDREGAEDMFVRRFGFGTELNTEDTRYIYGKEKGSMKLVSNLESNAGGGFQMTGFPDPDISSGNGFYFYVYNNSIVDFSLDINWMIAFTLKAGEWTRISVTDYNALCAASANDVISKFYSDKNLNGLLFNIYYSRGGKWQGMPRLEFYFSDFYRMPVLVPSQLNAYIDELPAPETLRIEDETAVRLKVDELETMYYSLSEYQRALVGFEKIAEVKQRLLWLRHPDVQKRGDTIVYFNSPLGLAQTDIYLNPSDKIEIEVTDKYAYGDEGASTHIAYPDVAAGGERWDLDIAVHTPMITDLSIGYDTYYTYIYNDGANDALYYAWTDDSAGWAQPLYKGRWNLVYLTDFRTMQGKAAGAARFNITNFKIVFAANPWNANAGASFYLSNIYALNEKIVAERLQSGGDDAVRLSSAVALYDILGNKSQRNIPDYDGLLSKAFNRVAERIAEDLSGAENTELEALASEIDLLDGIYKFMSNAAKAKTEESYRALTPAYIDRFVALNDGGSADINYAKDMLYRYGELNARGRSNVDGEAFAAFYDSFLTANGLGGEEAIASFGSPEGRLQADFRIQSDTGKRDEDWEKIFDLTKPEIDFVYTTECGYSTDGGSTKLTVPVTAGWDVLRMYLTVPAAADISSGDYDTAYFYVYNDSDVDYTLEVHWTVSFTLAKNSWTKVYINDWNNIYGTGTRKDIRGIFFDIHRDWNLQSPADLYFSSIMPANASTVNAMIDKLDISDPDEALLAQIREVYEMLSESQKAGTHYRDVALVIMKRLAEKYGANISEDEKLEIMEVYNALAPFSASDELSRWYADFYENTVQNVVDADKKIAYYGSALGFDQASVRFGTATGSVAENLIPGLSLDTKGIYDESSSMRVTCAPASTAWASVYMTVKNPTLTDIGKDGIFTYVYNDMSHDVYALLWPNRITLKAKSWNLLYIDNDSLPWVNAALSDGKIDAEAFTGFTLELFYYNANGTTLLYDGLDLSFTPLKAVSAKALDEMIASVADGDFTGESKRFAAEAITELYNFAGEETRAAVRGYEAFKARYYAYLKDTYAIGGDKLVAFDGEGGAKQAVVSIEGTRGKDVSFSEKPTFTLEKAYGDEAGSTRFKQAQFTADTAGVRYTVRLALTKDISVYKNISFAVYNESSNAYTVTFGGKSVKLASNAWTRVELDLSSLSAGEDIVLKIDFGDKLGRDSLYISAIYGCK